MKMMQGPASCTAVRSQHSLYGGKSVRMWPQAMKPECGPLRLSICRQSSMHASVCKSWGCWVVSACEAESFRWTSPASGAASRTPLPPNGAKSIPEHILFVKTRFGQIGPHSSTDPDMCADSKVRSLFPPGRQGGEGRSSPAQDLQASSGGREAAYHGPWAFAWSSGRVFTVSLFLRISAHFCMCLTENIGSCFLI